MFLAMAPSKSFFGRSEMPFRSCRVLETNAKNYKYFAPNGA